MLTLCAYMCVSPLQWLCDGGTSFQRKPEVVVGCFHGSGAGLRVLPQHAHTAEGLYWLEHKHGHVHKYVHESNLWSARVQISNKYYSLYTTGDISSEKIIRFKSAHWTFILFILSHSKAFCYLPMSRSALGINLGSLALLDFVKQVLFR